MQADRRSELAQVSEQCWSFGIGKRPIDDRRDHAWLRGEKRRGRVLDLHALEELGVVVSTSSSVAAELFMKYGAVRLMPRRFGMSMCWMSPGPPATG